MDRGAELLACRKSNLADVAHGADLVLIGVSDASIGDVSAELAKDVNPSAIYAHFAGSMGEEPLTRLAAAGARVAALHPVQACPSIEAGVARLPGSAWGVTCSEELRAWATHLIRDAMGGAPVLVDEADRPLWHAAAVTTSNGIAAVMAVGEAILSSLGIDPLTVLGPLARGTLDNAESVSAGATLTGPIVRGDKDAIARHLSALRNRPELADGYRAVASAIVAGALASGRVKPEEMAPIVAILERS